MKKLVATLCLAAACAPLAIDTAHAEQQRRGSRQRALDSVANPGAVVAAETALSQAIRKDGTAKALRKFATNDAVIFAPQPISLASWLDSDEANLTPVKTDTDKVVSSCDGSMAASMGTWQRDDGKQGRFVTIWERDPGKEYRWVARMLRPVAVASKTGTDEADDGFTLSSVKTELPKCKRYQQAQSFKTFIDDSKNLGEANSSYLSKRGEYDSNAQKVTRTRFSRSDDHTMWWSDVKAQGVSRRPLIGIKTKNGFTIVDPLALALEHSGSWADEGQSDDRAGRGAAVTDPPRAPSLVAPSS